MKTTAVKKAPKWGTPGWIDAYPWSKMDKDRRRRVRKALGMNENPMEGQVVDLVAATVRCIVRRLRARGVEVPANDIEKAKAAVETLNVFFLRGVNTLIATDLASKWHLTCDGECTDHCKSGKCTCKGKCKKAKNR